jgi:hypothetical protein
MEMFCAQVTLLLFLRHSRKENLFFIMAGREKFDLVMKSGLHFLYFFRGNYSRPSLPEWYIKALTHSTRLHERRKYGRGGRMKYKKNYTEGDCIIESR